MRLQMREADKIFFEPVFREGEIQFGRIFVQLDGEITSLSDLLIEKQWAVECDVDDFERSKNSFSDFHLPS